MNSEIELRSLIKDHLKCKSHDIRPYDIYNNKETNLIERPFETFRKWTKIEQTSYIESIFLRCSLQPIIRFVCNDHTVIIDGYNRYLSIVNFCSNKLKLKEKGLKQLKFLANKSFENLDELESHYFNNSDYIKFLDYSYTSKDNKILTMDEEIEIERYLHMVYNIGLKLEIEEMQKAEFSKDYITNKIREKILQEEDFLSMLEEMKQFNGHKKRNKIDNILLNCRLLIASTYSNINKFSSTPNAEIRIEENYLPNINDLDQNKIFQDFVININQIYTNLINTQKWQKYPFMHTKPFLDATYWLISVIRKNKLEDPFQFDFMKYLEYFGNKEEKENIFDPNHAHYKDNIYNKYYVVSKYYEKEYGHSLSSYFEENSEQKESPKMIKNITDLYRNHFSFVISKVQINQFFEELKKLNYNLKPIYQRAENPNIVLASRIIESILLGIEIPYILVYSKFENGKEVIEVVDGQQRLLSLVGYFEKQFKNNNGEFEQSNKNGYALKDLNILYKQNGLKIKSDDPKKKIV